jgi:amidophosphoribosyltransferase
MDDLQHECGVAALYHLPGPKVSSLVPDGDPRNVTRLMPRMLIDLQNRGQLAAGLTSYDPDRPAILQTYKEIGTVIEAFRLSREDKYKKVMADHAGTACIGHVRYATCGDNTRSYAQPFERRHGSKWKWFAFGFNGQLANFRQLREELLTLSDYHLTRDNDTEVIQHYIAHEHRGDVRPDLVEVFRHLSQKFDGAYNIVYLNAMGDMVVLRDPKGLRPLCFAQHGPLFGAASESVPLANLGFKDIQFLEPGEMIVIRDGGSDSPPGSGRPTASSSGSTLPTWPARWTTAACTCPGPPSAASWRCWSCKRGAFRSTRTRLSSRSRIRRRRRPTPWPTPSGCLRSRG